MKKPARELPDTNIIIRYLLNDDRHLFADAKKFFDRVQNSETKAVILESIVAECIYVLTKIYGVPKDKAAGSLIDILRYKGAVNKDKSELISALTMFAEQSLDIVDCILYIKAKSGGDHLFTFDSDLKRFHKKDG